MRILVICSESPFNIHGGRGVHVQKLYDKLEGKIDIHFLHYDPTWGDSWYPHSCFREEFCIEDNMPGFANLAINTRRILKHAVKLCQKYKFDIIHSHEWDTVDVAKDLSEITSIPWAHTFHLFQSQLIERERRSPTKEELYSMCLEEVALSHADKVVVVSNSMKEFCREERVEVVYNGVDIEDFDKPRSGYSDKPIVLYCGRLAEQKGYKEFLKAVTLSNDYYWILLGDFDYLSEEEAEAIPERIALKEFAFDNINNFYWAKRDVLNKANWFSLCDYVVMPSICEPFGIVALEAFASKKPLIVNRVDGLLEFCNDSNSYQAKTAEEIIEVLNSKPTKHGYETAKNFTWEKCVNKHLEIYKELYDSPQINRERML